jgi:signal transduction histidine kinase
MSGSDVAKIGEPAAASSVIDDTPSATRYRTGAKVDGAAIREGITSCAALTLAGRPCGAPWQVVKHGLCPAHAGRVDVVEVGRAGGRASGAVRREQAMRVRERVEQSRMRAEVDRLRSELRELEQTYQESRRRLHRDLLERRERFIAAARQELRKKLHAERAELRRLRRRRQRLESRSP